MGLSNHSVAIDKDKNLWAWGRNALGQIGDGTTTLRNSPVQIMTKVKQVSAGYNHTSAIKEDGTLWVWGNNSNGQLGDGTTTQKNSPVQVMAGVKQTSAGYAHTLALKEDGTLWAMGDNNHGQLGNGTTTDKTSPIEINFTNVVSLMNQDPLAGKLQKYLVSTVDGLFHFKDSLWSLIE